MKKILKENVIKGCKMKLKTHLLEQKKEQIEMELTKDWDDLPPEILESILKKVDEELRRNKEEWKEVEFTEDELEIIDKLVKTILWSSRA